MTHITQLTAPTATLISRTLPLLLAGFVMVLVLGSTAQAQWTTSGNNIYNTNTGYVGIGTSSPGLPFDVYGNSRVLGDNGNARVLIGSYDLTPMAQGVGGGIQFGGKYHSNGSIEGFASISGIKENANNGDFSSALVFTTRVNGNAQVERMRISSTGKVGIGTATPNFNFEISMGSSIYPALNIVPSSVGQRATVGFGVNAALTQGWAFGQDRLANGTRDMYLFDVSNTRDVMYWGANGNVGINTTSPGFKLDVQGGQINASGGLCIAGDCKTAWSQVSSGNGVTSVFGRTGAVVAATNDYNWAQINKSTSSLADLTTRSAGDLSSGTLPDARFPTALPALSGANLTALNASNLASGTVATARLGSGTANSTTFLRGDNTWAAVSGGSQWTTSGTNNIYYNTGNVGIGTPDPGTPLTVLADANALTFRAWRSANAAGVGVVGLRFALNNSSNAVRDYASLNAVITTNTAGAEDGAMTFWTTKAGILTEQARLDKDGNLGLGTTTPSAKLDVNGNTNVTGNLNVTGNIAAKYQDVAEWVPATGALSAGSVVTLDPTKSNHVEASSKAYDTRVAGVVSAQPGIVLGESGDHKVLVATTGRVRLKVDASNGPIAIGDLLVTSNIPGVAMKSQAIDVGGVQIHRPGTLIGKALEPLAKGTGEILVLLSLQ